MSLTRTPAKKMRRPALHVQLDAPSPPPPPVNPVASSFAVPSSRPLADYLQRNPRDPARESQYNSASNPSMSDRSPRSIRSIPETPGGTRGPDPLMNYTLRPEDMVTERRLGEGSAGTVSKVKHVPTGFVMARK
ncbi:hypothetical protein BGZ52_007921, partial [Haplosporangium bisporale]